MTAKDDNLRLVDLTEAAELTGRPRHWLALLVRTRRLHSIRSGNTPSSKHLILMSDLRKFIHAK